MVFDAIILGAGASGLACAIAALKRGKTVLVIEHNSAPLKKVAVSGGGRCNFTNLNVSKDAYVSQNPKFAISALKQFSQTDFIKLVESYSIKYYEKTLGQLFCKSSSQDIINMLLAEAKGAKFSFSTEIVNVVKEAELFKVATNKGEFLGRSVVVATGGASYTNLGASEVGYKIAKDFGLKIIPYKPALVPFNLDNDVMKELVHLKGISLPATITIKKQKFEEGLLFTHFGLSGPVVLQASLYWEKGDAVSVNLLPSVDIKSRLLHLKQVSIKKKLSSILKDFLPEKLALFILKGEDKFIAEVSNKQIEQVAEHINNWHLAPIGTQGFRLAEVTSGGVDTNELSSQTLESKKVPGLFFVGEVIDITGRLGGYNLQWCWSSGFAAGNSL